MKIITWNVNKFNGGRWNPKVNSWGNNDIKEREENASKIFKEVTSIIKGDDDIAILQEFPYHENYVNGNEEVDWKKYFEDNHEGYRIIAWYYNESDKKFCADAKYGITIAVVKKDNKWTLRSLSQHSYNNKKVDYSNRYIELYNKGMNINLIGVHPRNAYALREWLCQDCMKDFSPNMIVGDFNAGNYIKDDRDYEFELNRGEFLRLTEGFIDVCQGMSTTNYNPPTQVDHILIQNSKKFIGRIRKRDVFSSMNYSDHYPLVVDIDS